ncbi:MAG: CDP-glucose 4,6-dehydratase [Gammaproteobacteria bacterium]|nr:MAG: CDP-glucose 4,6-dehydratase [Gammaproteobacteria bacterium]
MKNSLFSNIYNGKTVFVTGHNGFKGSWLTLWLKLLGAKVVGYSLEPNTSPNHHNILSNTNSCVNIIADIRNLDALKNSLREHSPDIVFHLAAQPLVRESYIAPLETFSTNIIGSANLFEACREIESIKAIVNVTTDKCYENREWCWGYRESDPVGGYDPYSASKACSELITSSYRNSFFNGKALIASARAGNVIGGGDWAKDRIITDLMTAITDESCMLIRNPKATRPWQHVLDPLSGYLLLGQHLLENKPDFAQAWNFGPNDAPVKVVDVVKHMQKRWSKIKYKICQDKSEFHEATLLKLDCSKSNSILHWNSIWNCSTALDKTADWYREYYENNKIITECQLLEYCDDACKANAVWAR